MRPILALKQVVKRYGTVTALDGISLDVFPGERVALLGPNGAGKTTAVEIALGLRAPTSGSAAVLGMNPRHAASRAHIGATPQETGFPDALRVEELIDFVRANYPSPRTRGETLDMLGLAGLAGSRAGELSGGQQRRVAVAMALAGNPELVVLDEPTTGLDVESRRLLWASLQRTLGNDRALLFTTHYIEEAQSVATRVVVIDRGVIRYDGNVEGLRSRFGTRRVSYAGPPFRFGGAALQTVDGRVIATTGDTDAYVRALVGGGHPFSELEIAGSTLEDAFVAMTAQESKQ